MAEALREGDWRGRPRTFRINALDTPWFVHDLVEVIEGAQGRVDLVVVPKVGRVPKMSIRWRPSWRRSKSRLGAQHADRHGRRRSRARPGWHKCEAIAAASARVEALTFGPGDYAASVRMPLAAIGMPDRWDTDYPGHRWDYPLQRILVAARAAGVRAIDGPYADFRDQDGFRRSCLTSRALGYDGKWCIHPAQVPIANEVFTPDEAEICLGRGSPGRECRG